MPKFTFYKQLDQMDCGPTCLRMVAKFHGRTFSGPAMRQKCYMTREGVSLLGISDAAERMGFHTLMARMPFETLRDDAPLPFIAHWRQRHFVVVHRFEGDRVCVADPAVGLVKYTREEFLAGWLSAGGQTTDTGIVLLLETTPDFYKDDEEGAADRSGMGFLFNYLRPYRRDIMQLLLGMLVVSLLQLLFPFLTQSLVDVGINQQNIGFVNLILIAQLMLFVSRTAVEFIRSWILLHLGTRLNITILSGFLVKLMRLPISFFDATMTGDLLQRISDHRRIENFLTSSVLTIVLSGVNLLIFGVVLAYYNLKIFSVFMLGSALYTVWILVFLKRRRELDFKLFDQMAANQGNLIQMITGMQEIKLHNGEREKRWEWERIQARLYKLNIKTLSLNQYQQAGSVFINEAKNIVITYLAAKAVIDGQITLGMMLSVQYIIGQLNAPVSEMISFIRATQDARISLERLNEVHTRPDEETDHDAKIILFPEDRSLALHNVSFHYAGPRSPQVLHQVSMQVPEGKVTAIVGASGSGKTTLLKLLLKFYDPTGGEIKLGSIGLQHYSNRLWRDKCGAVLQDGFIFSDTIARNIAVSGETIDYERLLYAAHVANIREYVESLPLAYNTRIGADANGLSQGQKQRILIARAVYKNPEYLFFDEATNALDANNERVILENLRQFYEGRTVVVVAHRLSTVVNADQIIVLDKGLIIEQGTHAELTRRKGAYYALVKNQLELGV